MVVSSGLIVSILVLHVFLLMSSDDRQTAMWSPLYIIIGVMVAQMGGKAVVTAAEVATGSEGVYYRALEMTAAMALTKVGRNGGGC